ncbi:hypothetical protein JQ633_18570 [Bradyrhizobium tropiciagri]|uniref:alpha-pore-forming cytotoxin subunit MakB n=1 Tax=Bradyrhizobium tropiciagri TaxID=312253 RepID=UPI001BADCA14|nr:hypothetical protein [Bradyrhizobium tropiciagri]MBR0872375.1 hypothetical protein [Bradyrhizobium tropiciagri]
MLSPSINVANSLLAQAFNEVLRLDSYSISAGGTTIGVLQKDPAWLAPVRNQVGMLGQAGAKWIEDKPSIWGTVLTQFSNYGSAFAGVADAKATTSEQWIKLLNDVLLSQANKSIDATNIAATELQSHYQAFKNIQPLLESSINAGWDALQNEEQQMVKIAAQLTRLEDLVGSLQDSITAGDLSTGQSVVTTTVKTLYNVATGVDESFSFLGMAAAAFTVGKFYYDIITKTAAVGETLQQIAKLQIEASQEAQAAAGTKLVLRLLYNLELSFGRIVDVMPQIVTMWTTERDKVQQAIQALKAGANPETYFDIFTIPIANANWQAISKFAIAIPATKTTVGPPVTLDPQNPIAT